MKKRKKNYLNAYKIVKSKHTWRNRVDQIIQDIND